MQPYNVKKIISRKPKIGNALFYISPYLPLPLFLLIHITLYCNRKCNWCYQLGDSFFPNNCGNMDIAQFEKILISGRNRFWPRPHIHLYGGEPLYHPEFPLFLRYCREYRYKPTLTTNGDLLGEYAKTIVYSLLTQINISVNNLFAANNALGHNLVSGINFFTKINSGKKIINLNYVLDFKNYNFIEDTIFYFHNNYRKGTFAAFIIQHFMSGDICEVEKNGFDAEKIADKINQIKKKRLNFDLLFLPNIKFMDMKKYYYSDYRFKNKCYVLWAGLSIYPNLKVTSGAGVLSCNTILGDLNDASIREIWQGDKLRNFRLRLIKKGLPALCNRCCHKIYY